MKNTLRLRKYVVQERETGTILDDANTLEQAEEIVRAFEEADKNEGNYTEDYYEIVTREQLKEELPASLNEFVDINE